MRRVTGLAAFLAAMLVGVALPAAAQAEGPQVAVVDFAFVPDEVYVNAGDPVTWVWEGNAQHDVVPAPANPDAFEGSPLQTEGEFSVTFEEPGTVRYLCSIHSSPGGDEPGDMAGVVQVLEEGEPLPPPIPDPRPSPEPGTVLPDRSDNVAAALAWSSQFDDREAPTVLLARDDDFADALSSGGPQGLLDAPLLLNPSDELDDRVAEELERLGAERVVILGGPAAISDDVADALEDADRSVERVQGETRIETAVAVAAEFFPEVRTAILARGYQSFSTDDVTQAFADSLAAGGMAARRALPVLLTGETLSASTRDHLADSPIAEVIVVGGEDAVSEDVVTELEDDVGLTVTRLAGGDRFATAAAIAQADFPQGAEAALVLEGQSDDAWASGFAAASAAESAPILLVSGDEVPDATLGVLGAGLGPVCGPLVTAVACERARLASTAVAFPAPGALTSILEGSNEVPDPGDTPTGTGDLHPVDANDAFCFTLFYLGAPVVAAHVHRGTAAEAGPVVVPLTPPGPDGNVFSCVFDVDPALVEEIFEDPGGFYVNLHTDDFPEGAARGQLFVPEVYGLAELAPGNEVPPSGAQGGGFFFGLTNADDHTQLCYQYSYGFADGELIEAVHIHQGAADVNGDVVHPLELPVPGELGTISACDTVDPALVEALLAAPGDFYVNLHTPTYPDGAIRGQLFNPFAPPPPPPA